MLDRWEQVEKFLYRFMFDVTLQKFSSLIIPSTYDYNCKIIETSIQKDTKTGTVWSGCAFQFFLQNTFIANYVNWLLSYKSSALAHLLYNHLSREKHSTYIGMPDWTPIIARFHWAPLSIATCTSPASMHVLSSSLIRKYTS